MWSGGSDGLLCLILHNDYKIGLDLKRFIFNEKNILIKWAIICMFFFPSGAWNANVSVNIYN